LDIDLRDSFGDKEDAPFDLISGVLVVAATGCEMSGLAAPASLFELAKPEKNDLTPENGFDLLRGAGTGAAAKAVCALLLFSFGMLSFLFLLALSSNGDLFSFSSWAFEDGVDGAMGA
jgi:hypothetical protein